MLSCDSGDETFLCHVKNKLRESESLLTRGVTEGLLCYTQPAIPPKSLSDETAEITLLKVDEARIMMAADKPENIPHHELILHKMSAAGGRPLWCQWLGQCGGGGEQLSWAHLYNEAVPKMRSKTSTVEDSQE